MVTKNMSDRHKRKRSSSPQRITAFDIACEELAEYNKSNDSHLSYGLYSFYRETGKLPVGWYKHLIDVQKAMPKDFDVTVMEYQEYKRRYHGKLNYAAYIQRKRDGKLPLRWMNCLENSKEWLPKSFELGWVEYIEYCHAFGADISFYEYFEKKDKGELPIEWYKFLISLRKTIIEFKREFFA